MSKDIDSSASYVHLKVKGSCIEFEFNKVWGDQFLTIK